MNIGLGKGQEKLEKFMSRHKLQKLIYNGKGGFFESYLCQTMSNGVQGQYGTGSTKHTMTNKLKLIQSIRVTRDKLLKAQERIEKLQGLDQTKIEPLRDAFTSESRVFVVNDFIGQGSHDLYMLANIRGSFSDAEIGSIAYQIMK